MGTGLSLLQNVFLLKEDMSRQYDEFAATGMRFAGCVFDEDVLNACGTAFSKFYSFSYERVFIIICCPKYPGGSCS